MAFASQNRFTVSATIAYMAFPKTKIPIKPAKLKKALFAQSWCKGASARWKSNYSLRKPLRNNLCLFVIVTSSLLLPKPAKALGQACKFALYRVCSDQAISHVKL